MDWYPQAPLTTLQACRRRFVYNSTDSFYKLQCLKRFDDDECFYACGKTPNRRGTQIHMESLSIFVLSSPSRPDW